MKDITFTTVDPVIRERTQAAFEMFQPYRAEDSEKLHALLQEGVDTGAHNLTGSTLLIWAAFTGQAPMLRTLIAAGSDVHHINETGYTALACAVSRDQEECVGLLLDAGSNVDHRVETTLVATTLLIEAAQKAYLENMANLLAHGASLYAHTARSKPAFEPFTKYAYLRTPHEEWTDRLARFAAGTYTPGCREDWNHLASAIPLKDPYNPPSAADRRKMLEEMRPDLSLGGVREKAVHQKGMGL